MDSLKSDVLSQIKMKNVDNFMFSDFTQNDVKKLQFCTFLIQITKHKGIYILQL